MKKSQTEIDELRPEYDFSKGIRGKYSKRFSEGSSIVVIKPDIREERKKKIGPEH